MVGMEPKISCIQWHFWQLYLVLFLNYVAPEHGKWLQILLRSERPNVDDSPHEHSNAEYEHSNGHILLLRNNDIWISFFYSAVSVWRAELCAASSSFTVVNDFFLFLPASNELEAEFSHWNLTSSFIQFFCFVQCHFFDSFWFWPHYLVSFEYWSAVKALNVLAFLIFFLFLHLNIICIRKDAYDSSALFYLQYFSLPWSA